MKLNTYIMNLNKKKKNLSGVKIRQQRAARHHILCSVHHNDAIFETRVSKTWQINSFKWADQKIYNMRWKLWRRYWKIPWQNHFHDGHWHSEFEAAKSHELKHHFFSFLPASYGLSTQTWLYISILCIPPWEMRFNCSFDPRLESLR